MSKGKVGDIEAYLEALGESLGRLRHEREVGEACLETTRREHASLLGDRELGVSVSDGRLSKARSAVETCEAKVLGLTTASEEIERRMAAAESDLLDVRKGIYVGEIKAGVAQARDAIERIARCTREGVRFCVELRAIADEIVQNGRAYQDIAGGRPCLLPSLEQQVENDDSLFHRDRARGLIFPTQEAQKILAELHQAWGFMGIGQPLGGESLE